MLLPDGVPGEFRPELFSFYKKKQSKLVLDEKGISDGSRNDTIFKLACSLRANGLSETAILAAALEINKAECHPPLETSEVGVICASSCKYPKGSSGELGGQSDSYWKEDRYEVDEMGWLKPLGHSGDKYYYISSSNLQITSLTPKEHSGGSLLDLMPKEFFDAIWPPKKNSTGGNQIGSDLMQKSRQRGIYSDRNIRGRGLWNDGGKTILHLGNSALDIQSKQPHEIGRITSSYIYELRSTYTPPRERFDGTDAGKKLVNIVDKLGFKNKSDAVFLAGWLGIARLCGALKWRPHIWLVGGQGTGKSTIMNMLVKPLASTIGTDDGFFLGDSTVAGIKGKVGPDAIPILFDEVDSKGKVAEARVGGVIEFVRQCSSDSDAMIYKGTPSGGSKSYKASCMACFSSIKDSLKEEQDKSRFTVIELIENKSNWDEIKTDLENITEDYALDLWSQMLWNLGNILESIEAIRDVLVKEHTARMADQYSPLLAGYWHLTHEDVIGEAAAIELCLFNLAGNEHVQRGANEDQEKCKDRLMQSKIWDEDSGKNVQVFDAIESAVTRYGDNPDPLLLSNGMRLIKKDNVLRLAIRTEHPELIKIFQGTTWENYPQSLLRLPDAKKERHRIKTKGPMRCVVIDVSEFLQK